MYLATLAVLVLTVGPAAVLTWPAPMDATTRDVLEFASKRDAMARAVTPSTGEADG